MVQLAYTEVEGATKEEAEQKFSDTLKNATPERQLLIFSRLPFEPDFKANKWDAKDVGENITHWIVANELCKELGVKVGGPMDAVLTFPVSINSSLFK